MAADTYYIRQNGLFYDPHNARTGEVEVELIDCMGEALNYQAEYTAAAQELEQDEQRAEQHADFLAREREKDRIYIAISRMYDADKPATDPRNYAVTEILAVIDAAGRSNAALMSEAA